MEKYQFLKELSPSLDRKDTQGVLAFLSDDCLFQAGNSQILIGLHNMKLNE